MATHTIAGSSRGARGKTLSADTHDTVIILRDCDTVEVLHHGNVTSELYFVAAAGSSAPADFAVAADVTEVVLSGSALVVDVPGAGDTYVKLKSSDTVTYSVTGSRT